MSVTFSIANDHHDCLDWSDCAYCDARSLNVHNGNGAELLRALQMGTPGELWGDVRGAELATACRRVLSDHTFEDRIPDASSRQSARPAFNGRLILIPRPAGRLRAHVQKLLRIAEQAGDSVASFGDDYRSGLAETRS